MHRNGLHHVTAMAGRARRNLDFYTRDLGLRLVKKTVNFDDPASYHFYYGDELGQPGTLLTFFPWEHLSGGRQGVGETCETAFRIPEGAIGFWRQRFLDGDIFHGALQKRFGETVLPFEDPDGTRLALVAVEGAESEPAWSAGEIPAECAIRGLHGVCLLIEDEVPTSAILSDVFGFTDAGRDGPLRRLRLDDSPLGGIVDLRTTSHLVAGRLGRGTIHHLAFRAADDVEQVELVTILVQRHGLSVTGQKDRCYFRSVYFREPGGVLFEIATDAPGFTVDEPSETLGHRLKLPGAFEKRRSEIEAVLPQIV